jgi:hypothetical protein
MRARLIPRKMIVLIGIVLLYFILAIGMTWPLARQMPTHLPGGSHDTLVHYWNGWWAQQSLKAGQSPYYSPNLYYPQGMSLVYHNFAWFSIITWLAMEPLVGGFMAYDLSILINLALCGLTAFFLAYELTGNRGAAFVAGLIYQSWPFRLYQLDHPNLISTQWIPLFLLFLMRTIKRRRWYDGVLTGVFLVLTGYTRWQQLIPAAIVGGIYFLSLLPRQYTKWRRWLPPLLLGVLVTVLSLAPPFLMLIRQQRTAPADVVREDEEVSMQTDLLSYVTPSQDHPVLGSLTKSAYEQYYPDRADPRRFPAYVGIVPLIFAVWGAWTSRRSGIAWIAMALVLMMLALGPDLRFNGQTYAQVPMPYDLASRLYIVRLLRVPDRFNMFLALPVAMLAAYGLTDLVSYLRGRTEWAKPATLGLVGLVILFEYLQVPMALREPHQSQFYHRLKKEPGGFAVLNLPISALASKRYMFAQITHQHPIVQGKTPRFPEGTFSYIETHPWLQAVRQYSTMPPVHDDVTRQLGTLAEDGIRYVMLHKDIPNPLLRMPHWRHYFLIPPRFEDENILVYPTVPQAGEDFTLVSELAPGIGPIEVTTSIHCLNPGQPLGVTVGWGTVAPPDQNYDVKLTLTGDKSLPVQEQVYHLFADWPTGEWPANTVIRAYYDLSVPLDLANGTYTAELSLVDPNTELPQGPSLRLGDVTINEEACPFPLPPDATRLNTLYGNKLRLMGYELRRDREENLLTITLHWRSERLMEIDYKIFVHVFDPKTGSRPAQDDSMPLRWTYPTSYWSSGDVVVDEIPLSLGEAPPGVYQIAIGVYEPETGHRLPALDRAGELQPQGQLVLPDEQVVVGDGQ